ncbi:MAG: sulfurtransferase [Aureispira sp.]
MSVLTVPSPLITTTWLQQHLHHPQLILLDATISRVSNNKTANPAPQEGIARALFMDLKKKFSDQTSLLPNTLPNPQQFEQAAQELGIQQDSIIVIYDILGIYSSARAWWLFRVMGHQQVAVLDGGLNAWKKTGNALEAYQKPTVLGNFKANFKKEMVISATQILAALDNSTQRIFDARSAARFLGKEAEPRAGLKSGHIPNALNLPHTNIVQEGYMLPLSSLKRLFQPLVKPNQVFVFSCGSGVTACILLLAAELLGYQNLKLYDGSWSEWGQLEHVPIEIS